MMKVLILGATGHVGNRLCKYLSQHKYQVIAASRGRLKTPIQDHIILDTLNFEAMRTALTQVDAVVNCVAGDKHSIGQGAEILANAAKAAGNPMIIHLSTMSVYGGNEGNVTENTPFDPSYGWYAAAKCEAESHMQTYADAGGRVISFRPGCVHGPGSHLWVSRPAQLLKSYRLGDLGDAGDGWSNLVHVDDIVRAIKIGLEISLQPGEHKKYNLAAPDSPRWNQYLFDIASSIGATPIKRISRLQLKLDSKLWSPAIKVCQIVSRKMGLKVSFLPEPLPPSLVKLFDQHIFLNSDEFSKAHLFSYTTYTESLNDSIQWLKSQL